MSVAAKNIDIQAFLYPKFNTLSKHDGKTLDGRPYDPKINLPGPPIPQYMWDMDNDRNFPEPAWIIGPGERMRVAKQEQFYQLIFSCPEVFFGGARGGAKTVALLKSHVLKHLSWNARGIRGQTTAMFTETKEELIRRHVIELPKHFPAWLGWWDSTNFIYHFYAKFGGGKILFLYAGRRDTDINRLLSYNIAYATFDELTRNSEHTYKTILACIRSDAVPAKEWCMGSASNPGNKGHKWVQNRFVKTKRRKYDEAKLGERRAFIQSLPMDNPYLPAEYWQQQLAKLSPKMQLAYRDGDWSVFEGQFFDMLDESVHMIPRTRVPDEVPKYVGIDIGTNHPTGCVWVGHYPSDKDHPNGRLVVYRYYENKDKWPNRQKKKIWDLMAADRNIMRPMVLSHDAFRNNQSTEGSLDVASRFNSDDEWGPSFDVISSPKGPDARKSGWRILLNLLNFEYHIDETTNNRVIDKFPTLYFMDTPEIRMLFEELGGLVYKDGDSEDCEYLGSSEYDVGMGDEGPDALRYCLSEVGDEVADTGYVAPQVLDRKTLYDYRDERAQTGYDREASNATFIM